MAHLQPTEMSNTLRLADARNLGWVFATSDSPPAPWIPCPLIGRLKRTRFRPILQHPTPTATPTVNSQRNRYGNANY